MSAKSNQNGHPAVSIREDPASYAITALTAERAVELDATLVRTAPVADEFFTALAEFYEGQGWLLVGCASWADYASLRWPDRVRRTHYRWLERGVALLGRPIVTPPSQLPEPVKMRESEGAPLEVLAPRKSGRPLGAKDRDTRYRAAPPVPAPVAEEPAPEPEPPDPDPPPVDLVEGDPPTFLELRLEGKAVENLLWLANYRHQAPMVYLVELLQRGVDTLQAEDARKAALLAQAATAEQAAAVKAPNGHAVTPMRAVRSSRPTWILDGATRAHCPTCNYRVTLQRRGTGIQPPPPRCPGCRTPVQPPC